MTKEQVLAIHDVAGLRQLGPCNFMDRDMTVEEFRHIAELCGAFWIRPDVRDPNIPHALLTKGGHSDGFVNTLVVLSYTNLCHILAHQLVNRIRRVYDGPVGWVVGSDHAGAAFSHSVAFILGARHDFTEKGPNDTQIWKRFQILPGEVVLQVEELMTSSGTLMAVRNGIRAGNVEPVTFAPVVGVLVHRSTVYEIEDGPVISAFHYDMTNWTQEECHLCPIGSEALPPKAIWEQFVAKGKP
ncbi:MAG: hypothetical protein PHI73_00860 [Patescibacteria group bacterium]|nr:hypothetical protein [Patescibacteria group bacterium]